MTAQGAAIVRAFWAAMNSNDWRAVAERFLAPDFTAFWPQSAKVIEGPEAFVHVNAGFAGQGDWRFEILSLAAEAGGARVVTDIRVTNAGLDVSTRAITFHEIGGDLIHRQTEFWPDPYPVPAWGEGLLTDHPLQ
ncbi:MAG: nuclear transport factor 2 family protein [Paracoccus sp. (in: a-proteobacteria)]|uniref:nuclear transport factor 2 family protein n=1 Tax=Paracoccus sp. TaxID=267 RepID=UPI0026E02DEF|nr:nuclear transport factor 2 family protein [Paracoccus sp. (in: a-proteobacteria)]MDO5630512.1 nuclear transport factor 2 family protein [Paracoccus sp. (in: a-proteobacteria)]